MEEPVLLGFNGLDRAAVSDRNCVDEKRRVGRGSTCRGEAHRNSRGTRWASRRGTRRSTHPTTLIESP